jgi:hypothetical protein
LVRQLDPSEAIADGAGSSATTAGFAGTHQVKYEMLER